MGRTSVSTAAFDGYPMEVALAEIARAGAAFVEPAYIEGYVEFDESVFTDGAALALARAMASEGLSALAVSAHVDAGAPGAEDKLRRRVGFARAIGAGILITNSAGPADREQLWRNIEALLADCEADGVVLALENPGQKAGAGSLIGCGADGAALAAAFGSPWLKLNYDVGNVLTYGNEALSPETDVAAALPYLAHVHVKDPRATAAGWHFAAIGDGDVDCVAVAAVLARSAPDVAVGLELPMRVSRPGRGDPVRADRAIPLEQIRDAVRRSLTHWNGAMRVAEAAPHLAERPLASERRVQ